MRVFFRLLICVAISTPLLARGADWPVFRGPTRDGISVEKDWTHDWPGGEPKRLFQVNVKNGFSCPVVRGDRLWTMGHARGNDTVVCLDANKGTEIWSYSYPALRLGTVKPDYEGTRATPTLEEDRLYTLSRDGKVFCLDAGSGAVKWERDVSKDPGAAIPPWGFAGSPVVQGELLILNVGAAGLALDKATGAIRWQTGKGVSGYATPTVYETGGKSRLAMFAAERIVGVETLSGKELWSVPWKTEYKINSSDLIFHDGKLFASSAYNFGCALIDVTGDRAKVLWQNKGLRNHYNSSILRDGYLYGFDGNNMQGSGLKCVEFATGRTRWTAPQPAWGNLILAGDRLIIVSQSGELVVAKASSERFEELAHAQPLGGTCWTAPVLADGRLYLRNTRGDLVGLDLRK
ncbi:MAG: alcohol dehydrogenase [Phycisphaerales bacterium]|nr:alcohol dehydrogenase [Phycisphaerales bacterium]